MESSMQSIFELCKELESEMTGKQVRLPIISYKHILHVREDVPAYSPFDEKELLYHIKDIVLENDVDSPEILSKICSLYGVVIKSEERRENSILNYSIFCTYSRNRIVVVHKKSHKRRKPYCEEDPWFSSSLKDIPDLLSNQDDVKLLFSNEFKEGDNDWKTLLVPKSDSSSLDKNDFFTSITKKSYLVF